jgi:glyoxylase-like metal-dependent hydrolase (beta-lactamase superfamily II)
MSLHHFFKKALLPLFVAAAIVPAANAAETAPLSLKVYTADSNFNVTSTLVMGKTDAVLIDAQFTLADAHRLVADVLTSGKTLKTIFISHGDPDYYFGLEVLHQAFPQAKILATAATVAHIEETKQKKLEIWGPRLGANAPKQVIVPEVIQQHALDLEGQKLEITTLNSDTPDQSFVWIPSIKAIVGGVAIFGQLHVWTADTQTAQSRAAWIQRLNTMLALNPQTVVPGHVKPGTPLDSSNISFTRNYLSSFETELAKNKNSADLIKAMKQQYPNLGLEIALDIGAKVNTGEMKW